MQQSLHWGNMPRETGKYDLLIPRHLQFLNRPTRPATILSGTRWSLLIEILTGTQWVKEAIHLKLYPNNINQGNGIEIPEVWIPMSTIHNNRRMVQQRTSEGTATCRNKTTIGGLKCTNHSQPL